MISLDDTIAAIASPPGGAARGIVRISGPRAFDCLADLFRPSGTSIPACSSIVAGSLQLPGLHSPLPCEVYVWPHRSYTGQPVAEIHTIGSPPLLQTALRSVCAAGARLAGPGEFTLRAFLAGRIDLTQAEAVLGVIDAPDDRALGAALEQLAGGLACPLHRLRDEMLDLLAHLEAGFDFADEDLPFITREELTERLAEAENHVAAVVRQMNSRGDIADAVHAVLVGRPNAGKSSLFNAIIGGRAALVSHQPGTTRDYLVAELDLDGVPCRLIDTAGVESEPLANTRAENAADAVERAARLATETQRRLAHVQVLCLDSTQSATDRECGELELQGNGEDAAGKQRIIVLTKCDGPRGSNCTVPAIETSSVTGQGVEALRGELRRTALAARGVCGDVVPATAARCRESLRLASQCLQRARGVAATGQEELAAAEIRVALDEIGKVVGAVHTDDVLDRIFSRFCIGK